MFLKILRFNHFLKKVPSTLLKVYYMDFFGIIIYDNLNYLEKCIFSKMSVKGNIPNIVKYELVLQTLARSLGMLSKVRHYVSKIELKNIYHAIFESHLRYGCQIWYQFGTQTTRAKIDKLQKKALRIMSFSDFRDPSSPLFKDWKILKMKDLVQMQNCLIYHSFHTGKLPKSLKIFYTIPTRLNMLSFLYKPL